ncbi:MAG: hypothetical protein WDN48_09390 [Pseudolabrys sp.]
MPDPVSVTANSTYWASGQSGFTQGISIIEVSVLRFNRQVPSVRHRIARVDGEIENDILKLINVDMCSPQPTREHRLKPHGTAKRMAKQIRHSRYHLV